MKRLLHLKKMKDNIFFEYITNDELSSIEESKKDWLQIRHDR